MDVRSRGWCFTVNNYIEQDSIDVYTLVEPDSDNYLVFGYEKGEKGTPHIQGYVHFKEARSFRTMKKLLPTAHIEVAKGSPLDNYKYCTKEGDFIEVVEIPRQGKRTDAEDIRDMILEGRSMRDIILEHPGSFMRYSSGIMRMSQHLMAQKRFPFEMFFYWGKSGVGKTTKAISHAPDSYYIKSDNDNWWDGYEQQDAIIFDDFSGKYDFRDLLKITQQHSFSVNIKGSKTWINSKYIIFTADRSPADIYEDVLTKEELYQFTRRFNGNIIHLE